MVRQLLAEEAESQTNLLTKQFTSVTVRLNHYYLSNPNYGYTDDRICATAEHELGHAMYWFEHTVMKSGHATSGSQFHGIQVSKMSKRQFRTLRIGE